MKILNLFAILLLKVICVLSGTVYKTKVDTYLNVRSGPGTGYSIVGKLYNNQLIFATSVSNGWAKFYNGYASTTYLTKVTSGGKDYVVTADALNFRTGPYKTILTTLKQNTVVKYYGTDPFNTSWYITNQGYASSDYLKPKNNNNNDDNNGQVDNGSQLQVAKDVYSFFKGKGWSKNAICGLLGNMERESALKPDINEYSGGGGYGLVQWTPGSILKNWANNKGLNYRTTKTQCQRIQFELENGIQYYKTNACPLTFSQYSKSTKSPEYLAECFMRNYERPGVLALAERKASATKWCKKL